MKEELIQIGGKSYKKCDVVMLPTEKAQIGTIMKCIKEMLNDTDSKVGAITINKNWMINQANKYWQPQHIYILSSEEIKEGDWYMYCHFGEWIISNSKETLKNKINTLENLNKKDYFKKIIATTNSEVKIHVGTCFSMEELFKPLPRPSDDFIKAFVKAQGKGFDKVLIEINTEFYADSKPFATKASRDSYVQETGASHSCWTKNLGLKVSPDNTITIKPVQEKTSWNRKEVVKLCMDAMLYSYMNLPGNLTPIQGMNKWIEKNL